MLKLLEIYVIRAVPFILLVKKQDYKIFTVTMEDIKKVLELKQYINPQPLIPEEYYNIINKFKKRFTDQLPPYWNKHDFKIKFKPSMTPKFSPLHGIL